MAADSTTPAETSTAIRGVEAATARLRAAAATSRLVGESKALGRRVKRAAASSRLYDAGRTLAEWTRRSFVFRWLTREPDPEVIVIDLRETRTVGPIIAALDGAFRHCEQWWHGSHTDRAIDGTVAAFHRAPIRALSVVAGTAILTELLVKSVLGGLSATGILLRAISLAAALGGTRIRTPGQHLARAKTIQLLAAALEPPEPPEGTSQRDPGDDPPN